MSHDRHKEWAAAFARQARSDLNARNRLSGTDDRCHQLHFSQMAAEKICKAYLYLTKQPSGQEVGHCVIAKHLRRVVLDARMDHYVSKQQRDAEIRRTDELARELDLLSPNCPGSHARQDNSEYPWKGEDSRIIAPCDYTFPNVDDTKLASLLRTLEDVAEHLLD